MAAGKKVRIDIIAGFLGAGKTTFILNLLKDNPGERVVICENEFGTASIDASLLRSRELDVFELREGCICCTLKVELVEGLRRAIDEFSPDRVIIEPTGLAQLGDILSALEFKDICGDIEVDLRAVLLDGAKLRRHFDRFLFHFGHQQRHANGIFVTKTEDYTDEERAAAISALRRAYPDPDILLLPYDGNLWERVHGRPGAAADAARAPAADCAASGAAEQACADGESQSEGAVADSTAGYAALSFAARYRGSKEKFEAVLQAAKSCKWGEIVRAKGTVYDADMRPYRLDYAADLLTIEPAEAVGEDAVQLIGVGLNALALRSRLSRLAAKR